MKALLPWKPVIIVKLFQRVNGCTMVHFSLSYSRLSCSKFTSNFKL